MSETPPESELVNEESDLDLDDILVGESAEIPTDGNPEIIEDKGPEIELNPIEKLAAEADKWRDTAARNQADLENFRKRMAREKSDAIQYANGNLLQSLLPVIDNFEMGLKAAASEGEGSMVYMGMVMVQKQMNDFLEENNVEIFSGEGQAFDPNIHEAVKQEPSDDVPEGNIIYELRRGYKLRDRLLRAANVVVSTGPDTGEKPAEDAAE